MKPAPGMDCCWDFETLVGFVSHSFGADPLPRIYLKLFERETYRVGYKAIYGSNSNRLSSFSFFFFLFSSSMYSTKIALF